jgi:hypothetical protein
MMKSQCLLVKSSGSRGDLRSADDTAEVSTGAGRAITITRVHSDAASYCVLRVCARAPADAFWAALRAQPDVPPALGVLLAGRIRVELSRHEASEALAWASGISGWDSADPKPLFVYDPRAAR